MVRVAAFVALLLAVSGCSDPPASGAGAAQAAALDEAASQVAVEATKTTGIIRGVVVDDAVRPLSGASVVLQDGHNATTGADGAFGFEGLAPGLHFLVASRIGYAETQQSTIVEAGVADPPIVRIQLQAVDLGTPYVEAYQTTFVSDMALCIDPSSDSCFSASGSSDNPAGIFGDVATSVNVELFPNATVAQTETHWDPTQPSATVGRATCSARLGFESVDQRSTAGESPLVARVNATGTIEDQPAVADSANCDWRPSPGPFPFGAAYGQILEATTHVFYHFVPREDWVFGRDGEYPVPSCNPAVC